MKTSKGFTLIELVVVITILGILAAVALPRFTNLQRDARIAKLNAARGAVNAASAIIHGTVLARGGVADTAVCLTTGVTANNGTGAAGGTVCTEGGIINNVFAYPAATAPAAPASIIAAAGLARAAGAAGLISNPSLAEMNAEGFGAVAGGGGMVISVIGGPGTIGGVGAQTNATCSFTYIPAAAAGGAPVITGITAATTAGC